MPKVELHRFAIYQAVLELRKGPNGVTLDLMMEVNDFDNPGCRTRTKASIEVHPELLNDQDPEAFCMTVEHFVKQAVAHEVDECLFVDGSRVQDPHPEDPHWGTRTARVVRERMRPGEPLVEEQQGPMSFRHWRR